LANIEEYLDHVSKTSVPLGRRFDFIVGTSTGGIIALALATGRTAAEVAQFYEKLIPQVFHQTAQRSWTQRLYQPKYNSAPLRKELERLFGKETLQRVQTHVCATAVSLDTGRPRFYKSHYQAINLGRLAEKLSDVALATSAAPTFFQAHNLQFSERLIDGGVCANNPAVIALVDALRFEWPSLRDVAPPKSLNEIVMLSVGTGKQPTMPYDSNKMANAGLIDWAQYISDAMFESQSVVADVQAGFLLGENYLRINPNLSSALPLDDVTRLSHLKNISDIGRVEEGFIKKHFL
jgi:patatin-like phospholipase/acyl hydrolase